MPAPQPPVALEGHCSAIHDGTLYVLSPNAFQSLPLKQNATWTEAPMGLSVTSPSCVKAVPGQDDSQAALYVVGGSSNDSRYHGLQRYVFANQSWEALTPLAEVLKGRTNHSVAYLHDSSSILVYAGTQPGEGSELSSQTFLISTIAPYQVRSFVSDAPPASSPILQPWNSSHAVVLGGGESNTGIYLFGPDRGWRPLGTDLTTGLAPGVQGAIVDGDDGSKVLETFDMSATPNRVSQIVLLGAGGRTASTGQTIGGSSSRKRKRGLNLGDWPAYNSSLAPTTPRSDYSVAQDPDGLTVISGGSADSPLSLFDQRQNSWVDTGSFFQGKSGGNQVPLGAPTATTPSSSLPSPTTSSSSASGSAVVGLGQTNKERTLRTLGITLGVLCGIAALFIFLLLLLRWRKMRQKRNEESYVDEKEKNRMSFADRGASFMREAGGSMVNSPVPQSNNHITNPRDTMGNNRSRSSLAIMVDRLGANGHKRNTGPNGSYESTTGLVKSAKAIEMAAYPVRPANRAIISRPIPRDEPPVPAAAFMVNDPNDIRLKPDEAKKRSSGWSRYFAPTESTSNSLRHIPSAYISDRSSVSDSQYANSQSPSHPSRIPSSAMVPPLDIDFLTANFDHSDGQHQRLSHVTTRSPAFSDSREDLARRGSSSATAAAVATSEGHTARLHRHTSASTVSTTTDGSALSSDAPSSYRESSTAWTPAEDSHYSSPTTTRSSYHHATSSYHTAIVHDARNPIPVNRTYLPLDLYKENFPPPPTFAPALGRAPGPSRPAEWAIGRGGEAREGGGGGASEVVFTRDGVVPSAHHKRRDGRE
ncbi:hypothetical protein LTR66_014669, partial [Elasticomyces elasticus]